MATIARNSRSFSPAPADCAISLFSKTLMCALLVSAIGCSNPPACPTGGTPGVVGTTSTTSSGTMAANKCSVSPSNGVLRLVYWFAAPGTLTAGTTTDSGSLVALRSFAPPTLPALSPSSITIVSKQFLFIPMGDTTVQAFRIDHSTGALTPIPGSPYTVPTGEGAATSTTADPTGHFLYVGSNRTGEVWGYLIDSSTGALTTVPGSPFTAPSTFLFATNLTVDASGKFLYAGQADPALGVMAFSIDQRSGVLTEVPGSPFHLGIGQVRANPMAEFVAGLAQTQDESGPAAPEKLVHVFSIAGDGALTPVSGSPFSTVSVPHDLMFLPNGQIMYTFGTDSTAGQVQSIEGFQMNLRSGALTTMTGSPFHTLPTAYTCQPDQSGSMAICMDALRGNTFSVFSIDSASGALTHTGSDLTVSNTSPFAVTN